MIRIRIHKGRFTTQVHMKNISTNITDTNVCNKISLLNLNTIQACKMDINIK